MTKETIIERLLDQGHITIPSADVILNKKPDYVEIIESLHTDGPVNTEEAVILLNENPTTYTPTFPFMTPNTFPTNVPPYGPDQPHWRGPDIYCAPNETPGTPPEIVPGQPSWKWPDIYCAPTYNTGTPPREPIDLTGNMDNINSI
jgi:hypothetical protein